MKITGRWRKLLIGIGVIRLLLAIVAIPLAPALYNDHFLWLVLIRPTKEVFLAGGFLARQDEVNILAVGLAAIPLSIFGVWLFYALGRSYRDEIHKDTVGGPAAWLLKPERVKKLESALEKKGGRLIFLARLAVMSSAAVAAASGAANLAPKSFFPNDLAGGLLSIIISIGAGYFLGEAYERAGPWLTGLGVVALLGFANLLGRALKRA